MMRYVASVAHPELARLVLVLHNATFVHWFCPWGPCCIWADFAHSHFTVPPLSSHYRIAVLTPAQACSTHTVLLDLDRVPQMSFVCLIIQVTDNQIGSAQIQLESALICELGSPPGRCSVKFPWTRTCPGINIHLCSSWASEPLQQ